MHITASPSNIQRPRSFLCNECTLTTYGSPLLISKCGQSFVRFSTNKSFVLQDLLHIPAASRNLLSVNKFCCDNDVSLLFDSQRVQVRDPANKDVLMEGRAKGGI